MSMPSYFLVKFENFETCIKIYPTLQAFSYGVKKGSNFYRFNTLVFYINVIGYLTSLQDY